MRQTCFALMAMGVVCWSTSALAAANPALVCETSKLKVAAKYGQCLLKAEAKAAKAMVSPDFTKCDATFSSKWGAAESKAGMGVCPSENDEADLQSRISEDANTVAILLNGVSISRTGPASTTVSNIATYTVQLVNNGASNATNIDVRDVYGSPTLAHIPVPNVSMGTIATDGALTLNSGTFHWTIPVLAPLAQATLSFSMQPIAPGQILNYVIFANHADADAGIFTTVN